MKAFSTLVLVVPLATARSSKDLRRSWGRPFRDFTCTLSWLSTEMEPTEERPKGYHEYSWICKLPSDVAEELETASVVIADSPALKTELTNAIPGGSTLTVNKAFVNTETSVLSVPKDAVIRVDTIADRNGDESGPPTTGMLKALVIRLIDNRNRGPDASIPQLENDIFLDKSSLKTQMEACSYGKLRIEPFTGKTPSNLQVDNGIVDVKMDYDISATRKGDKGRAERAARKVIGDLNDPMFDLVMFCFPPGSQEGWLAGAGASKFTYYNNHRCSYVATQMHEIGHNLGLGHSGTAGKNAIRLEYGDRTGVMGSGVPGDDAAICYNPQKSYQLGWYKDKTKTITLSGKQQHEFLLNGVADYKKNNGALMVLRLHQRFGDTDYYMGFNRAQGINRGTGDDHGMVTIHSQGPDLTSRKTASVKEASLLPGQGYVIENFNGETNVYIYFVELKKHSDAKILILTEDHCSKYTVQVITDKHPEDTSWDIVDPSNNYVFASYSTYKKERKKYIHEVCLPTVSDRSVNYEFTIHDEFGDGICCHHGKGSYKVYDYENGKMLFEGGHVFGTMEHSIVVSKTSNTGPVKDSQVIQVHPPKTRPTTRSPTRSPTKRPTRRPTSSPAILAV